MKYSSIALCLLLIFKLSLANRYSSNFPWRQVNDEFHPTNIAQTLDHSKSVYASAKFPRSVLKEHSKNVPVYISLASCSFRFNSIQRVIKSILSGTVLPDQIYIIISKDAYLLDRGISKRWLSSNTELAELIESTKLITVVYTNNIGPHRKLIPILAQTMTMDALIVTIDDDAHYKKNFLEELLKAYVASGENAVVSYRSRRIGLCTDISSPVSKDGYIDYIDKDPRWVLATYMENITNYQYFSDSVPINAAKHQHMSTAIDVVWPLIKPPRREMLALPTGTGGVLYHPSFFKPEVIFDKRAIELTGTNDDLLFRLATMINQVDVVVACHNTCQYDDVRIEARLHGSKKRLSSLTKKLATRLNVTGKFLRYMEKQSETKISTQFRGKEKETKFESILNSNGGNNGRKLLAASKRMGLWTSLNQLDKNNKMFTNLASYMTQLYPFFDLETVIRTYVSYDRYECVLRSMVQLYGSQPSSMKNNVVISLFQLQSEIHRKPLHKLIESDSKGVWKRRRNEDLRGHLQICGFFQCSRPL